MIPIRSFLIKGAKSEKTVESIRRNITVQGGNSITSASDASNESLCKGKRKEKGLFWGEFEFFTNKRSCRG